MNRMFMVTMEQTETGETRRLVLLACCTRHAKERMVNKHYYGWEVTHVAEQPLDSVFAVRDDI